MIWWDILVFIKQQTLGRGFDAGGYMRMSVGVCLCVLTCTDTYSAHGCMWEERLLMDYSPHL